MAIALTFGATSSATASSSVATFTGIAISSAAADRVVLACVTMQQDATFTSCTINGEAAFKVEEVYNTTASPDIGCAVFAQFVPTGTTANITVTVSSGNPVVGISTIKVTGSGAITAATISDTDEGSGTLATITLTALTIPTSGGAVCVWANDTHTTACAWTGMTEVSDAAYNPHRHSVATSITAGTTNRVADGATAQQAILGIAFRQGARLLPALVDESADTFYAPTVTQQVAEYIKITFAAVSAEESAAGILSASLYEDADTFYAPTVARGVRTLTVPRYDSTPDTFYAPTITRGARTLTVPRFDSTPDTFYAPTVTKGVRTVTVPLYSDTPDTFYAPTIQRGAKTITVPLFSDTPDTFYAPTVAKGARTLTPGLYSDTPDTFYAPSITRGVRTLTAALYSDTPDTFYAPTIQRGVRTLTVSRVDDTPETFYAPTVIKGVRTLTVPLFSDTPDTFYAPRMGRSVHPALYTDTDTFYAPDVAVTGAGQTLTVPLYEDTPDTFYSPTVLRGALTLSPNLYTDDDTFYAPTVAAGAATLFPALYTDADNFYTPQVYRMEFLYPDADLVDGGWTNELDSNVNLFDSINEIPANDNDYIKSSSEPVNDITKIGISNPVPVGQTQIQPFKVKYRYKKLANMVGTMELKVRLMQGASLIAEWTHSDISGTYVDGVQELTLGQFNSITDFDDLNVEFEADWAA